MNTVDLLFYFFATLAVGGGILMVFSRHPVSAALFMIISLSQRGSSVCSFGGFLLSYFTSAGLRRCCNGFISLYNNAFGCRS